jgi:hypothetical protein
VNGAALQLLAADFGAVGFRLNLVRKDPGLALNQELRELRVVRRPLVNCQPGACPRPGRDHVLAGTRMCRWEDLKRARPRAAGYGW